MKVSRERDDQSWEMVFFAPGYLLVRVGKKSLNSR